MAGGLGVPAPGSLLCYGPFLDTSRATCQEEGSILSKATGRKVIPLAAIGIILLLASFHEGSRYTGCLYVNHLWGYACGVWLWSVAPGTVGTMALALAALIYNERH